MIEKNFKEIIQSIIKKQDLDVIEILDDKKYINEFLIAKKLKLDINQTRNILYRLSNDGLVSFIRKKDKRKGWYTYFWKIETIKFLEFLKEDLSKKIEQLRNQIKSRETKRYYICERCKIEHTEENALLHNFICNECGEVFALMDNSKILRALKKESENLEKKKNIIEKEIEKEKEKLRKKKQKEFKKGKKLQKKRKKNNLKKRKKKGKKKISKKKKPLKKTKIKKVLKKTKKKK